MLEYRMDLKLKYVLDKLDQLAWFRKTSPKVKQDLENLGEEFLGYLMNLSQKEFLSKNKEIIEIKSIRHSNKLIITTFKTRSTLTNQEFEEELVSFNEGHDPMNQGVILLEGENGEIENVVFLKNGPISMYYPNFSSTKVVALPQKTENQIKRILGVEKIQVKQFIDLGKINRGTNVIDEDEVGLFAVVLKKNRDDIKKNEEVQVISVAKIFENSKNINHSLLLSIFVKLKSLEIIK